MLGLVSRLEQSRQVVELEVGLANAWTANQDGSLSLSDHCQKVGVEPSLVY